MKIGFIFTPINLVLCVYWDTSEFIGVRRLFNDVNFKDKQQWVVGGIERETVFSHNHNIYHHESISVCLFSWHNPREKLWEDIRVFRSTIGLRLEDLYEFMITNHTIFSISNPFATFNQCRHSNAINGIQ